ncbi:MAG: helix-turn-helix transcriptional regulator [Verrucomicrobiota bacterium]
MDKKVLKSLGKALKHGRIEENLTQNALAELVDVDWTTIGCIERGVHPCNILIFIKICQVLKLSPSEIFDTLDLNHVNRRVKGMLKGPLKRKRKPQERHLK